MFGEAGSMDLGESGNEQRTIKRQHLIYYLRVYDGISSKVIGHVVDISQQGLKLITDVAIGVQEEYRLRMHFPGSKFGQDELIFDAICRWCRRDDNPDFYLAGFRIQNLKPEEANFIQGMITELGM